MFPSGPRSYCRLLARASHVALSVVLALAGASALLWAMRNNLVDTARAETVATLVYPGCGATIQACLDAADPGETLIVQPGTYMTSLTLNKAVSLTGVASNTVVLHALADQRVLTVTGAAIDSSVVISGLTFTGGSLPSGTNCPANCGGGILIDDTAQPLLVNVMISGNSAYQGGGLFANAGSLLRLTNSQFISNTSGASGGGALTYEVSLNGGLFQGNQCTDSHCRGGGLIAFSTLTLTGTHFISNTSILEGGGAFVFGATYLHGAVFQGNQCIQSGCGGGGLFYAGGPGSVVNSLFAGNMAGGPGAALYVSSGVTGVALVHNTIAAPNVVTQAAVHVHFGTVGITNTIFANHTVGIAQTGGRALQAYNLFDNVAQPTVGTVTGGAGSLTGTASFANPAGGDYRLTLASAALDAGTNVGVDVDSFGSPRPAGPGVDIGFHEVALVPRLHLPLVGRD